MKFSEDLGAGRLRITAYDEESISLDERRHAHGLCLTHAGRVEPWRPTAFHALTLEDLAPLLASDPEVILLGTGRGIVHPPAALRATLAGRGIGLEVMDWAAACRTWNILLGEGRRVAAAILPPEGGQAMAKDPT